MNIHELEFGGVHVGVPQGWQDQSILSFLAPPLDGYRPNLVVLKRIVAPEIALEAYVAEQREALLSSGLEELSVIHDAALKLGGRDLHRLSYTALHPIDFGGRRMKAELRQDQYFELVDGVALTMTFSSTAASHETVAPLFDAILSATGITG